MLDLRWTNALAEAIAHRLVERHAQADFSHLKAVRLHLSDEFLP